MARHGVNVLMNRVLGSPLPYATAVVNITGCAIIGALAGALATGQVRMGIEMRSLVFVGVLGGFTTFSSLGLDTLSLVHQGRAGQALGNVAVQVGIGLAAVFAGYAAAVSVK